MAKINGQELHPYFIESQLSNVKPDGNRYFLILFKRN